MMALPGGERVGRRERERERVGMFFVKKCLMIKRTRCNFLCWLGSLGENVVISVEKKDCMICTDMSEFS